MSEKNPPQLFLSPTPSYRSVNPASYGLTGILGKLAHRLGLDVHGPIGLSQSAAIEMKFAAFLLVVIFSFDCLAWTMLWNVVFNKGLFQFNLYTGFAFIAGLIFAMATLVYERQFLTTDSSDKLTRMVLAVTIRILVLGGAAYATSQPIELLWFNGPIQERIHEEHVRHIAASELGNLEETLKDTNLTGLYTKGVREERDAAKTGLRNATQSREEKEKEMIRENNTLKRLAERLASLKQTRVRDERHGQWLARQISQAEDNRRRQAEVVNRVQTELDGKVGLETEAMKMTNTVTDKVNKERTNAALKAQRLRDWIAQLQTGAPGEPQTEKHPPKFEGQDGPEEPWVYTPANYDFFQRLRILEDFKYGRSAKWKDVTPEDKRKLINIYKIKDTNPDPADALEQAMRNKAIEKAEAEARDQNKDEVEVLAASRQAEREIAAAIERLKLNPSEAMNIDPDILAAGRNAEKEARETLDRLRDDAELFSRNYRIAFFIAIAIPLLVFAMKLIMGRELRNYYSSKYQRLAGNYEIMLLADEEAEAAPTVTVRSRPIDMDRSAASEAGEASGTA